MTKKAKNIIVFSVAIFSTLVVCASIPLVGYLINKKNSRPWSEKTMSFRSVDPTIYFVNHAGYIKVDENVVDVSVGWKNTYEKVYFYQAGSTAKDECLLDGKVTYKKDIVKLEVNNDKIFNHQYEIITFKIEDAKEEDYQYLSSRYAE